MPGEIEEVKYFSLIFSFNRFLGGDNAEGVTGLKELGVRDLNYRLVFLAYHVVGSGEREAQDTPEDARMKMSQDD